MTFELLFRCRICGTVFPSGETTVPVTDVTNRLNGGDPTTFHANCGKLGNHGIADLAGYREKKP